jgi:hypothetical protein
VHHRGVRFAFAFTILVMGPQRSLLQSVTLALALELGVWGLG